MFTLLFLSSIVVWLFLTVPRVCLQFVIVVFPDHTHLLSLTLKTPLTRDCSNRTNRWKSEKILLFRNTGVIGFTSSRILLRFGD